MFFPLKTNEMMGKDLINFWKISRPLNVFISALAFGVACGLAKFHPEAFWTDGLFWCIILTIIAVATTGYWINDVYDFRIDRINKPQRTIVNALLSVKKVVTAYLIANVCVMLFSWVMFAHVFHKPMITFVNATSILCLLVYAAWLKRVSLAGNVLIAFLTALVVLLAGYAYGFSVPLAWMAVFAFEVTLLREITKDAEDIRGDVAFGLQTLPIQVGLNRTRYVLYFFYAIFVLSCWAPAAFHYWRSGEWLWQYLLLSLLLVQFPVIWLVRLLRQATQPEDFTPQSKYLKYLIFTGILSLFAL